MALKHISLIIFEGCIKKKEVINVAEEYLTKEQRKKYLAELNQDQREVLNKYKKYKVNSGLLTQVNQDGVFWQLQEELVNESYDFHNPKESPPNLFLW